ncbi:MAG: GxxExxY protein [Phycisphaerales bacterium]
MNRQDKNNHGERGDTETRSRINKAESADPDLDTLIERVIGAAIEVHRELGPGFQEITYHRALMIELDLCGITYESERLVSLDYKGRVIGEGRIDLLIENRLVIELKAADSNPRTYSRQVASYLKATGLKIGLVINFHAAVLKDGIARVINR